MTKNDRKWPKMTENVIWNSGGGGAISGRREGTAPNFFDFDANLMFTAMDIVTRPALSVPPPPSRQFQSIKSDWRHKKKWSKEKRTARRRRIKRRRIQKIGSEIFIIFFVCGNGRGRVRLESWMMSLTCFQHGPARNLAWRSIRPSLRPRELTWSPSARRLIRDYWNNSTAPDCCVCVSVRFDADDINAADMNSIQLVHLTANQRPKRRPIRRPSATSNQCSI